VGDGAGRGDGRAAGGDLDSPPELERAGVRRRVSGK
jgi:hypothetical protein